jgi:hypothetical protein
VFLTGLVAVGLSAFGHGTDGFANRITNIPDMSLAIGFGLATLIVALFVSLNSKEPTTKVQAKTGIAVSRVAALVIVVPMILIGIGNLAGSAYSLAVYGPPSEQGLGVSRAEMRQIMLDGEMAPFWRVVDEKVPDDMTEIIEGLFAHEDEYRTVEDGRKQLNNELVNYRVSLAAYGSALTDEQRKEIIRTNIDMLRKFKSKPKQCADVAMTGGTGLTQAQILTAKDELNRSLIVMTENLLDARQTAAAGAEVPVPPTEDDYGLLFVDLSKRGMSDGELQALLNLDAAHPDFCSAIIGYMEAIAELEGPAGEAVRFEVTQAMLTAAPQ